MNWANRIKRAKANGGRFTAEDCKLANNWVTCACGEQDPRIPARHYEADSMPDDSELARFGYDFHNVVVDNKPYAAERILSRIETRAGEILVELGHTR